MIDPSPRSSRLAILAGLIAVGAVGGAGFIAGQHRAETPVAPAPVTVPTPVPVPGPVISKQPVLTLGRAEMIALAAAATDAVAGGVAMPAGVREAVGARFAFALTFGCNGPDADDSTAPMRWRYDEAAKALRLHVAPTAWAPAEWWSAAPVEVEAIEGFWIDRPWTSSEDCPLPGLDATLAQPEHTLAIAQFFGAADPRQSRRDGKPYTSVVRIDPAKFTAERGFRLRMAGQVTAVPGGDPVKCRQTGGAATRPVCVIAVTLDEVSIENPATGETVATWAAGGARGME